MQVIEVYWIFLVSDNISQWIPILAASADINVYHKLKYLKIIYFGFVCISCPLSLSFSCPHPQGMNEILRPFLNKALFGLSKLMDPWSVQIKDHLLDWIHFPKLSTQTCEDMGVSRQQKLLPGLFGGVTTLTSVLGHKGDLGFVHFISPELQDFFELPNVLLTRF